MSLFDDAFSADTEAAQSIMAEPITVGAGSATAAGTGIVSPLEFTSKLSQALGGRTEAPAFSVFLTPSEAQRLGIQKGWIVVAKNVKGRVLKTVDLGGGGLQLECGPMNSN